MSANYRDLLKYAATGIASPSMTYYDKLKALAMAGGGLSPYTIIGQPPISFLSDGTPLTSVTIKGNGVQSGTPSPQNIVPFDGTGERTGNLFDGTKYVNTSISSIERWEYSKSLTGSVYRVPCKPNTQYTLYLAENINISIWRIRSVSTDVVPNAQSTSVPLTGSYADSVPASKSATFTTSSDAKYILFQTNESAYSDVLPVIMLIEGTTKIPYEPFGWAEKITCAGQTTPLYLGEVSTTRRVKKLVFDGSESWNLSTSGNNTRAYTPQIPECMSLSPAICTHFDYNVANVEYPRVGEFVINSSKAIIFGVDGTTFADVDAWKSYLAAQYAAGHPVTVWYVLATEQTGIVNEPLMKIGDYADELTTTTPIPTAKGSNTLTVDTTVQPSEMSITGNIKSI